MIAFIKCHILSIRLPIRPLVLVCILLVHSFSSNVFAQSKPDSSAINTNRLLIIGGISAAAIAVSYGVQDNIWWKGEKSAFHFNWSRDWDANLGSDKFGHFYFSFLTANLYSQAFEWAGMSKKHGCIYGGLSAMLHQTFTEVRDGFSKQYGFSFGDYAFNLLGASLPLLQYEYPVLKALRFKISYYPSERFREGSNNAIIDDYESTYNWLSIDINSFLPDNTKKYFPDFIDLTIGHSVKNLNSTPTHEFFIGLDWDFESLPGNSSIVKILKRNLNFYHFPSPVVKIYPNVVWYGLKF